jgi:dTDP-3-amino-3,4,6-trideoxy-alpha-D-glucose transaminase
MSGTTGVARWRRVTTICWPASRASSCPARPVWHLYVVQTKRRAELVKALDAASIGSLIHYPIPPHLQQAYADLGLPRGSFPLAETLADTVLSLPIGPHMSPESVEKVAAAVRRAS